LQVYAGMVQAMLRLSGEQPRESVEDLLSKYRFTVVTGPIVVHGACASPDTVASFYLIKGSITKYVPMKKILERNGYILLKAVEYF